MNTSGKSNLYLSINTLNTKKLCTLSGPSFAKDMIKEELIGLSLAATNRLTKNIVKEAKRRSNSTKAVYTETKNVISSNILGIEIINELF